MHFRREKKKKVKNATFFIMFKFSVFSTHTGQRESNNKTETRSTASEEGKKKLPHAANKQTKCKIYSNTSLCNNSYDLIPT